MHKLIKDLTGKRFGKLKVLKLSENRTCINLCWLCECDCGNLKSIQGQNLKNGKTKSCGCLHRESYIKKNINGSLNALFARYKLGAKRRGYKFELTKEQFESLTSSKCHYCLLPPFLDMKIPGVIKGYVYNGIDRKDNSIGYTLENSVSCCTGCNLVKGTKSYIEMLSISLTKIALYRKIFDDGELSFMHMVNKQEKL